MGSSAVVEAIPEGFRITGAIDIYNASEVAEALKQGSGDQGTIDLTGLDFLDSSGLAVIVNYAESLGGQEITLVVEPGGAVHRLVNLVALPYRLELRGS